MKQTLPCPFCGGEVKIMVCDDEGNIRPDEYEDDAWSGRGYVLVHKSYKLECPIASVFDIPLGVMIYDSREEAIEAWNKRTNRRNNNEKNR